ncbi:MAG: hypothetical protein ABIK09_08170 [Pseudomonadota bacterium]
MDEPTLTDLRRFLAMGDTHFEGGRLTWHYAGADFVTELPHMVGLVKRLDASVPLS